MNKTSNQQLMHSNQNYKVMARLRESREDSSGMIEIDGENFI